MNRLTIRLARLVVFGLISGSAVAAIAEAVASEPDTTSRTGELELDLPIGSSTAPGER